MRGKKVQNGILIVSCFCFCLSLAAFSAVHFLKRQAYWDTFSVPREYTDSDWSNGEYFDGQILYAPPENPDFNYRYHDPMRCYFRAEIEYLQKTEPHLFDTDYTTGNMHFGQIWYGWSWWDKRYLTLRARYYEKQFLKAKAARPAESLTNLLQSAAQICAA